ncbi:DUF6381 family protein [Streptomyces sp. NBC_01497]|uniref:DUF6381 family protein n=1 Tax=Streptomyces sp. NBC_01497 TaxID=2903885 RepID=UPI002E366880|nr:DUF6381 family protein [Streptomyces sp. NBC_01497]
MDEIGESHRHVREMREKALALKADAEQTDDAEKRRQLQREAGTLEFNCEQESMMAAGDIYPVE